MKELKKLNKLIAKYKWQLIGGLIVTVISRILSLVLPKYVGKIINLLNDYDGKNVEYSALLDDPLTLWLGNLSI